MKKLILVILIAMIGCKNKKYVCYMKETRPNGTDIFYQTDSVYHQGEKVIFYDEIYTIDSCHVLKLNK